MLPEHFTQYDLENFIIKNYLDNQAKIEKQFATNSRFFDRCTFSAGGDMQIRYEKKKDGLVTIREGWGENTTKIYEHIDFNHLLTHINCKEVNVSLDGGRTTTRTKQVLGSSHSMEDSEKKFQQTLNNRAMLRTALLVVLMLGVAATGGLITNMIPLLMGKATIPVIATAIVSSVSLLNILPRYYKNQLMKEKTPEQPFNLAQKYPGIKVDERKTATHSQTFTTGNDDNTLTNYGQAEGPNRQQPKPLQSNSKP